MTYGPTIVEASGETAAADLALCKEVCEELNRYYPEHGWLVTCRHDAGTISIDLPFEKPKQHALYGMLLHITSLSDEVSKRKIMRAGGELLERWGIGRRRARPEDAWEAKEHGLDIAGAITHSTGSKVGDREL